MTAVDSSCWIEFFTGGPLAGRIEPYLREPASVLTSVIVLFEVYKIIKRERTEEDALVAAAQLQRTNVISMTESLALLAGDVALERKLAMADAMVYATALGYGAELLTADADFKGLPGVVYLAR